MNILIAEDDRIIAGSLKKNFFEEGHFALITADGESALKFLEEIVFDILLLDWRMPKVDGITVCRKVRESGNNVPIILVTALSDVMNKVEALDLGADDYITKPFSFIELLARINAVLRRVEGKIEKIQFDDLTLDLFSHVIYGKNIQVKLTDKEFELLRFFLNHKGVILNKELISREIWGSAAFQSSNVIEVTVKKLRRKIEENFGKEFIKSVYGEGYSFVG